VLHPRAVVKRVLKNALRVAATLALFGLVAGVAWIWSANEAAPAVCEALRRARIAQVLLVDGARVQCERVSSRDLAPLGPDWAGLPIGEAVARLAAQKATALGLVPGAGSWQGPLLPQLAALQHVSGLRGVALAPEFSSYTAAREPKLSARESDALAYVARALFRGAREPNVSSFPSSLRKVESVEVIVTLSERGRPLLWRSVRGTSIARTMLTAVRVARDRWRESEHSKGGPLEKRLLSLDVEVGMLSEDGTLASLKKAFVDDAITKQHGLGFDFRNDWHYLSPAEVLTRGKGSAYAALQSLMSDKGLAAGALNDPNLRVYRFVPITLGVSKAPLEGAASNE
jgi:hypothetical protein